MHYPTLLHNMLGEVLLTEVHKKLSDSLLTICLVQLIIAVHFATF